MEIQIRIERERVAAEEEARVQKLKDEMTRETNEKDQQLREFVLKHQEVN